MQFSLRTLLIIMGVVCVFCASLNVPVFFSVPIYFCVTWLAPAYWVVGTVFAEGPRRAFFIGGLTSSVVPFIVLTIMSVVFFFEGPWRWQRSYGWDDRILANLIAAFLLFSPVAASFLGGWLGYGVYYMIQTPKVSAAQPVNRLVTSGMQTPENVN